MLRIKSRFILMVPHHEENQTIRMLMLQTLRVLLEAGREQGFGKAWQARVAGFQGFLQTLELYAWEEGDRETLGMLRCLFHLAQEHEPCAFDEALCPEFCPASLRSKT